MQVVRVLVLGLMVLIFTGASVAKGGGGGQGGRSGQAADKGQSKLKNANSGSGDQIRDQTQDKTKDQTQDQTRSKVQDRDRIHTPNTGTTTPTTEPASN